MSCTGRKWCDLVIRTTVDLHVERVMFDPEFWKSVMCHLHSFYFSAILPELAVPSLQKGGIRGSSEWLHDSGFAPAEVAWLHCGSRVEFACQYSAVPVPRAE